MEAQKTITEENEELKALIARIVNEQLKLLLQQPPPESKKVADLTVAELRTLITQIVDERLILWLQEPPRLVDPEDLQKIFESIDNHIWTPPPGAPTGSEIIIAEREKWRQPM
jgi:hypothetical protein